MAGKGCRRRCDAGNSKSMPGNDARDGYEISAATTLNVPGSFSL
jgi:hypothetical protein